MDPVFYLDVTELANDLSEISELTPAQITENILRDVGSRIVDNARQRAPKKTGRLSTSISFKVTKGSKLEIDVGAPYGTYQEFGTGTRGEFPGRPYVITPKQAKVLRFTAGGKTVYTRKVTHPGIPARPYLRPAAIEEVGPLLDKLTEKGQALIIKGPNSAL